MLQRRHLGFRIVTSELNRRESELRLLHIVIDLLVEVLTHVRLENDREMVTVPLPRAASLQTRKTNQQSSQTKKTYIEAKDH